MTPGLNISPPSPLFTLTKPEPSSGDKLGLNKENVTQQGGALIARFGCGIEPVNKRLTAGNHCGDEMKEQTTGIPYIKLPEKGRP